MKPKACSYCGEGVIDLFFVSVVLFFLGGLAGWSAHFFVDSHKPGKAYFFKSQWDNCLQQLEKEMEKNDSPR